MLEPAIKYRNKFDEIQYGEIWFNDKYKFWNSSTYYSPITIDGDTWNRHQFVSVHNGEIIGYIAYDISRDMGIAHSFNIINFTNNKIIFGRDVWRALDEIFTKYGLRKLSFSVVVGNPIEKTYDKLIDKYGGRIVGTMYKDIKLTDGKFYDRKYYEIFADDYLSFKG